MGFEKYYMSIILIMAAITTFGLLLADASVASGHTSSVQFTAINKTIAYQQRLTNSTNDFTEQLKASSKPQDIISETLGAIFFILQSVSVAVISLLTSIDIGISLIGDVQGLGFVPTFFIGLAILWLIITIILSVPKAIKQGDME